MTTSTDRRSERPGIVLTAGPTPHDWREAGDGFRDLEALGCSAIWLTDHLFWHRPMPEALTLASVAATSTRRCTVGTGVLQLPLRRTAAVARAATTIQQISGGRLILGLGVGEHAWEYDRAGASFATRGRDLDRAMDQMRDLWTAPAGPDDRLQQLPRPSPIPLWVGGRSNAAIRRTTERADGWMPLFITPERYRRGVEALTEALERSGREPDEVEMAVTVIAALTRSDSERRRALEWCNELWRIDPGLVDRYLVTGSRSQVLDAVGRFREAGAHHVSILVAGDRPVDAFAELRG